MLERLQGVISTMVGDVYYESDIILVEVNYEIPRNMQLSYSKLDYILSSIETYGRHIIIEVLKRKYNL